MALKIKLSATVNDKTASQILLQDTTGAYDVSTNPGGYGSANELVTPTKAVLKYKYWTDTEWLESLLSTEMTDLLASGLLRSPSDLGSSGVFADGIHQLQYFPLNNSAIAGTFTSGSKLVALSDVTWDPNDFSDTACFVVGLTVGGAKVTKMLEVDWDVAQTTSQVTLKEEFDGDTVVAKLWFGPMKDIKFLVNKAAEACIAKTLVQKTVVDCGCSSNAHTVTQMIQWRFTADVLFDCADYIGAHNTLVQINRVCNPSTCVL